MARAIWSGSLSFGLVNVPVGLYSATQDKTIHFNQFEEGTSDRIRYKKVNERTGREVPQAKIVKGFNLGDAGYVMLSDEELTAADPERSRTISILDFVDASDIDPLYYRSGYYLAPQGEGARRAYALLREAMADESKIAIASLVMRNKEYLVTVRPDGPDRVLILQTMFFSDEVRSPAEELPNLPGEEQFSDRELCDRPPADRRHDLFVGPRAVPRHPPATGRGAGGEQAPGQGDRPRGAGTGPQGRRPHGGA